MRAKQKYALKDSWDDKLFSIVTGFFILLLTAVCLIPFLYLLAESLSGAGPVMRGEVFLIPKEFTLETYRSIFQNGTLVSSLFRTVFLTIASVLVSMTVTVMCAYPPVHSGAEGQKGNHLFHHGHHVFLRRHDPQLSAGSQAGADRQLLVIDPALRPEHL